MSLKAFHILFVTLSILLAFGFGGWELVTYSRTGAGMDLFLGVASLAAGVGLVFYLRKVIRKLKGISLL
ncbi:MAG: hypothetical protein H7A45_17760 [Verrucomicrobiales bacterium]|nr:hypothetical protein [Verrucomicrobiales bacterium]MCP5525403.1 hypothetical protein [Verrucomicrobiales bacterium]